jgi:hypothetical protein
MKDLTAQLRPNGTRVCARSLEVSGAHHLLLSVALRPGDLVSFLSIWAAVCLGLFCVCTVGRLHFLGIRAARVWIALLGGLLIVANGMGAGVAAWTMIRLVMPQHSGVLVGCSIFRMRWADQALQFRWDSSWQECQ